MFQNMILKGVLCTTTQQDGVYTMNYRERLEVMEQPLTEEELAQIQANLNQMLALAKELPAMQQRWKENQERHEAQQLQLERARRARRDAEDARVLLWFVLIPSACGIALVSFLFL